MPIVTRVGSGKVEQRPSSEETKASRESVGVCKAALQGGRPSRSCKLGMPWADVAGALFFKCGMLFSVRHPAFFESKRSGEPSKHERVGGCGSVLGFAFFSVAMWRSWVCFFSVSSRIARVLACGNVLGRVWVRGSLIFFSKFTCVARV